MFMSCIDNTLSMLDKLDNIFDSTQDELDAVDEVVESTANIVDFMVTLVDMFSAMAQSISRMFSTLGSILRRVPGRSPVNTAIRAVGTAMASIGRRAVRLADRLGRRIRRKAERLRSKFMQAIAKINGINGQISSTIEAADEKVAALRALITFLAQQPRICDEVGDFIAEIDRDYVIPANQVLDEVQAKLNDIAAKRRELGEKFVELGRKYSGFAEVQASLSDAVNSLQEKVDDADAFIEETKASVQPYIDSATETIQDIPIINKLFDALVTIVDTVEGWVEDIVEGLDFLFGRELSEAMASAIADAEAIIDEINKLVDEIEEQIKSLEDLVQPILDQVETVKDNVFEVFEAYTGIRLEKLITEKDLPAILQDALQKLETFKRALERLRESERQEGNEKEVEKEADKVTPALRKISNQLMIFKPSGNRQIFGYPVFDKLKILAPEITDATKLLQKSVGAHQNIGKITKNVENLENLYLDLEKAVTAFNADNPRFGDQYFEALRAFDTVKITHSISNRSD
jgi:chromosome segregation ATPase